MQSKTPFLFSMPPLFAWPLAFFTSIALILAVHLVFSEPSMESESAGEAPAEASAPTGDPGEAPEEAPAQRQVLTSTGLAILIGLLIVSVGLIPMMARRKRMKVMWWSLAGVGTGFVHLYTSGLPLVHPLILLLALVFMRPSPPAELATATDVRSLEVPYAEPPTSPPGAASGATPRRRPPRRRRRPRS